MRARFAAPGTHCLVFLVLESLSFAAAQPQPAEPQSAQVREPQTQPPQAKPSNLPAIRVTAPKPRPRASNRPRRVEAAPTRTPAARPAAAPSGPTITQQAGSPGAQAAQAIQRPPGEPITTIDRDRFKDAPDFSIGDVLEDSPGISIKQGNGPRDVGISIRGSNAQNGFGIRNLVMLEDGFPVMQPDGLSRSDLTDPHAYNAIDVYRGPSSPLYGNFATGGAINFHTRTGQDIDGFQYGSEAGSFGYLNNYLALGRVVGPAEYSLFASDVRGDGFIANSEFSTQTVNFLGSVAPSPNDRIIMKFVDNYVGTELPIRLSLAQFQHNPFQRGCTVALNAAPGCATVSLFANGESGTTEPETAEQAGLGRHDHRTIAGVRWEHDFDADTTWRTQAVFDDKDINQPTGSTSAVGNTPAVNFLTDLTHKSALLGFDATQYIGLFYNAERLSNFTYNVAPGGSASVGALSSFYNSGAHQNMGARAREEVKLDEHWTGVIGIGAETTDIATTNFIYSFPTGVPTPAAFPIARDYFNYAPEAGLVYRANPEWQFRGRVAEGYGTPQISNLTVTPQGVSGNNTQLASQTNLGFDIGADWTPAKTVKVSVTGFYEFFRNELVTQSPGAGLQSYTFNAPASEHRGVELAIDWRPLPGWQYTAAYTYDNQIYTNFIEELSAGQFTARFNRAGDFIPGVSPNELLTRLGYDQPSGAWRGLGGFIELAWQDTYYMDNANLLKAPGYELVNVNLHYNTDLSDPYIKSARVFFEIKNLFNKTYVASANNISDTISAATGLENPGSILATTGTGSIYAGSPRAFIGGMTLAFR
jgi:iron complex outermembrane recepter protein